MTAIEQNALAERSALISDRLAHHLRLQIKRVGAESPAGIGEARGANLQGAAVIADVSGDGNVGKAVFLEDLGVGRVGSGGIRADLRQTLPLPTSELLRQKRRRLGLCGTGCRVRRETRTGHINRHRQSEKKSWKAHGWTWLFRETPPLIRPQRAGKSSVCWSGGRPRPPSPHDEPALPRPFTFQVSLVTIFVVTSASPSSVPLPTHPSHSPFADFVANWSWVKHATNQSSPAGSQEGRIPRKSPREGCYRGIL